MTNAMPARGPELAVREATVADVDAIVRVTNLAYRVESFIVTGERTSGDDVRALLAQPHAAILLAESRDGGATTLVGAVCVETRGLRGHFGPLAVSPDAQGRGVGRLLVRAAESWCHARGCTRVELEVVSVREGLPAFYAALGYEPAGRIPFPIPARLKAEADLLVMAKALVNG